jgi:hypothetical protein
MAEEIEREPLMSLLKKLLILGLCLSALSACGVRGDPVPPSKAGTVVN